MAVGKISRVVLMFATLLFAYFSVALLCALHHTHDPHVLRFTSMGTITGLVGMLAGFSRHPCVARIYGILLLIVVGAAVHGLHAHLGVQQQHCECESTYVVHVVSAASIDLGFFRLTSLSTTTQRVLDEQHLQRCNRAVVHMFFVSVAVVAMVGISLIWCTMRLSTSALKKALLKRNTAQQQQQQQPCCWGTVVVPVGDNSREEFLPSYPTTTTVEDDVRKPLIEVTTVYRTPFNV